MLAAYCGGSVDFVRDMHPDMGLMSYAETGVPAEAVSEGEWSYFVPLTDFKDNILANYNGRTWLESLTWLRKILVVMVSLIRIYIFLCYSFRLAHCG